MYLAEAGASTRLTPLFDRLVQPKAHIIIFGGDGYINNHRARSSTPDAWLETLEAWANRGCRIDYILTNPEQESLIRYLPLSKKNIGFHLFNCAKSEDTAVRSLAAKYDTFHPSILTTNSTDYLWLETFHPRRSAYAFGVRFLMPSDAAKYSRLAEIKRDAMFLINFPGIEMLDFANNLSDVA